METAGHIDFQAQFLIIPLFYLANQLLKPSPCFRNTFIAEMTIIYPSHAGYCAFATEENQSQVDQAAICQSQTEVAVVFFPSAFHH